MFSLVVGWIGAAAFGFCGLPQAIKVVRDEHADGLDMGFLMLWTLGEICTFYAVAVGHAEPFLIANYVANAVFLGVIWSYKLKPRKV